MTRPRLNAVGSLVLIALTLGLGGCATDRVKAPPGPLGDPLPPTAYPQIVPMGGLARWIYFDKPIVTPGTADRPMRVSVPARMVYNEPRARPPIVPSGSSMLVTPTPVYFETMEEAAPLMVLVSGGLQSG